MARLLVSYELLDPQRREPEQKALYAALDSLGAVQVQDSLWLLHVEMTAGVLLAELQGHFSPRDRVAIIEAEHILSRNGVNGLPTMV